MLPKQNRLKKQVDFSWVYSNGAYVFKNGITLKYVYTKNLTSRVGFPISKNFSKKSVTRNKARRMLRESVRLRLHYIKTGFDIVIIIKAGTAIPSLQESLVLIDYLFKKANLFI